MLVSNPSRAVHGDRVRTEASVRWEESDRPPQTVWFDVEGPGSGDPDPNIFLLATCALAVAHGEARLVIPGPISPLLYYRLVDVVGWWRHWGMAPRQSLRIETTLDERAGEVIGQPVSGAAFLSGGVDSLHMLQHNLASFGPDHPHRIRRAILVQGFDTTFAIADQQRVYDLIAANLTAVVDPHGIAITRATTNVREVDDGLELWAHHFHGAALAASAHAALSGPHIVRIAGTYDIPNMAPLGSHPLIDASFSTERLSFIHEGITFSRLDKVRALAQWPAAFAGVRVCTKVVPGHLNCGLCEKCMRTKLAIRAIGADIPSSFRDGRLEASLLSPITNSYQAACYRDVVRPLRARGEVRLAAAIEQRLRMYIRRTALAPLSRRTKNVVANWDARFSGGAVKRLYQQMLGYSP